MYLLYSTSLEEPPTGDESRLIRLSCSHCDAAAGHARSLSISSHEGESEVAQPAVGVSSTHRSRGISPFLPLRPAELPAKNTLSEVPTVVTGKGIPKSTSFIGVGHEWEDSFHREVHVAVQDVLCELVTPQTHLHFGKLFTKTKYEKRIRIVNNVRVCVCCERRAVWTSRCWFTSQSTTTWARRRRSRS